MPDPDGPGPDSGVRVLHINGPIAEESWFDDDVTPGLFADELNAASGGVMMAGLGSAVIASWYTKVYEPKATGGESGK